MKKSLSWVFLSLAGLCFVLASLFENQWNHTAENKQTSSVEIPKENSKSNVENTGNQRIENFDKAKRILKKIYWDHTYTFYCGCYFSDKGIDFQSCGFQPYQDLKRAKRIEWEHIVPASDFGRSFLAWREGDLRCKDKHGTRFRGRNCAKRVSPEFNLMEADLYNLVPAIGEVNGMRKDYPMGLLPGLSNMFGTCKTKIANGVIEPREEVRGFIARTYKYMNNSYRGHGIISRKNEKLFDAWDKQYPPDTYERERARRIAKIQGNINIFVEGSPKLAQGEDRKPKPATKP